MTNRKKHDGEWVYHIDHKDWKCPDCNSGHKRGDGLCIEDGGETVKGLKGYLTEGVLVCYYCNAHGYAISDLWRIAERKQKDAGYVTCPCCKGVGKVKKAEK
jgi:hypothetical protein